MGAGRFYLPSLTHMAMPRRGSLSLWHTLVGKQPRFFPLESSSKRNEQLPSFSSCLQNWTKSSL